jgi:Rrf2 family protein
MKISAQDEYGLRTLIRIAKTDSEEGLSIAQLGDLEGISHSYMAKLTRHLRLSGFIESTPGRRGGYILSRPANEVIISEVLKALDGSLFSSEFCQSHSGDFKVCANSVNCSVRSLWRVVQQAVDSVLTQVSLHDLIHSESQADHILHQLFEQYQPAENMLTK